MLITSRYKNFLNLSGDPTSSQVSLTCVWSERSGHWSHRSQEALHWFLDSTVYCWCGAGGELGKVTRYNTAMGKVEAYCIVEWCVCFVTTHTVYYRTKNIFAKIISLKIFLSKIFFPKIFSQKKFYWKYFRQKSFRKNTFAEYKICFLKGGGGALLLPAVNVSHNLDNKGIYSWVGPAWTPQTCAQSGGDCM